MSTEPQNQQAFPLAWPAGWPRTDANRRQHAPFFSTTRGDAREGSSYRPLYKRDKSMSDANVDTISELGRLNASSVVVSTNVELKQDGTPYANRRPPADPGVAVYFRLKGKAVVLACDKWLRVEDNLYAIAKHIEALRGQQRWGVGSVEKAFAGYAQLAAPGQSGAPTWWAVLGVAHDAPFEVAQAAYREKARAAHPDNGGAHDAMSILNESWDQARKGYGR